ncbi:MAG: phage minor head protein [Steroidobacteraceae bacterium]
MRINGPDLVALIEQAQRLEDFERAIARLVPARADAKGIVDFFDVPTADLFNVPPEQAIGYFQAKGLTPTFSYADMLGEANDHAFTVAKMMDVDLLGQVRASLDSALANGTPFKEWADQLLPSLQSAGWWGRKEVLDPLTGQVVVAQLGSPWRLETIFRTNMQSAYAAGQWKEINAQADLAPFLMYDAVDDFRTREQHRLWDRKVLPVASPWWKTHYPPNGWNCRCGVIQLDATEVKRLGLQVDPLPSDGTYTWKNPRTGALQQIPNGLDPGFDKNSGIEYLQSLKQLLAQKTDTLSGSAQRAALKSQAELAKAVAELTAAQAQAAAVVAQAEVAAAANLRKMQAVVAERALQLQAQQQIDLIGKGKEAVGGVGAQYKVKALAQLKKADDWPELKPTEQLAAIEAKAAELKKVNEQASKLALYKKAVLEGKTPAPAAVKAYQSLPIDEQVKLLEQLDAQKAALAAQKQAEAAAALQANTVAPADPATPPKVVIGTPPNPAALTQIGPQRGSNPGGLYRDTETGAEWYVKQPTSADVARNEVLAGKLYELAGIDVPELHLITLNGVESIASRIVTGLAKGSAADLARAAGTADGFVVDAWLANWDVVGLGFDNLLLKGSRAFRVDTGGALRYRAQGGLKGSAFGDDVPELESLRDPSLNRQAQAVFGNLTAEQLEAGAVRVLSVTPAQIRELVRAYGPTDAATADALVARLIARQDAIAARFPGAARKVRAIDQAAEAPPPVAARVTAAEQRAVEDSRVNGYGFATDSDQIEDNMVLVHAFKRADGADATRGYLKLRPTASRALLDRIADSASDADPSVNVATAREAVLAAVKSINFRADKGQAFDLTTENKAKNALLEVDKLLRDLDKMTTAALKPEALEFVRAEFTRWRTALATSLPEIQKRGPARKVSLMFPAGQLPDRIDFASPPTAKKAPGAAWKRVQGSFTFEVSKFDRSFATETSDRATVSGVSLRYEATLPDGTRLTYFPHDSSVAYAMQGIVRIDVPGKGQASTSRVFGAMDEAGLKSTRATELDRQHLYVNAFARIKMLRGPAAKYQAELLAIEGNDADALKAKLAVVKKATGIDLPTTRGWATIDGVRQAFGHGRAYQLRADLDGSDFEAFGRDYVLFHNPQGLGTDAGRGVFDKLKAVIDGGGVVASLADRVRRGVELSGSSVSSDLQTGGGDYVFTRIRRRGTSGTGVYWKAAQLRRMDAITYDSDRFGRVTEGYVEAHRLGQDVASFKAVASSSGNETIFKGGVSLFDDVDRIVLADAAEVADAIKWLKARGYATWPDGRELSDVIITKAKNSAKP